MNEEKKYSEKDLQDFLRRHGYYVPETEEETQNLRHALDTILEFVTVKRSLKRKAGLAFIWGLVLTLTAAAVKETTVVVGKVFTGGSSG